MNTQIKAIRLALTILLVVYWLAMFVATHVPRVPQNIPLPGGDKGQHLIAYAGLAFLIAFRQSLGRSLSWKRALTVAGLVGTYGIIDELTQIPVGRTADLFDWFADVTGCAIGLALLAGLRGLFPRMADPSAGRIQS